MVAPAAQLVKDTVARTFREEGVRIRATLVRACGDLALAEDAFSHGVERALETWPQDGIPGKPGAWLLEVARRRALDHIRRARRFRDREAALGHLQQLESAPVPQPVRGPLEQGAQAADDQLRLVFTSCNPVLSEEARVALTLQVVGGLTAEEIAHAFLVPHAQMEKRLTRAKQKLRDARVPFEIPSREELPERLNTVLAVIYLVFNEGYLSSRGDALVRRGLCDDAIRLARMLHTLMPDEPECGGLLGLLLLVGARQASRMDENGHLVLLEDQDRSLWNRAFIDEGTLHVDRALAMRKPGPYQIQGAIAALHAAASTSSETDWAQIAALYSALVAHAPTPVVRLNHAVAVAFAHGWEAGLSLVNVLAREGELDGYHLLHATRADLLRRMGDTGAALKAYRTARRWVRNAAERTFLDARIAQLEAHKALPPPAPPRAD